MRLSGGAYMEERDTDAVSKKSILARLKLSV